MKYICVYCGSSTGKGKKYLANAKLLGESFAKQNIGLIYGGSENGTMGALASSCLNAGGTVIGIMSQDLLDGVDYHETILEGLTETIIVPNLTKRKRLMIDKADGFIALPGGLGTIDEVTEVMDEYSCGFHQKPVGLLNTNGYYNHFKMWFTNAYEEGFMYHVSPDAFTYEEDPIKLLTIIKEDL